MFYTVFFLFKKWAICSFPLFGEQCERIAQIAHQNERCKQIAQVAHQKWATMSDLLRSLTKNEQPWANCSGRSPKMSEWLVFLSESLICTFLSKKRAIRSENRWANWRIPSPGKFNCWRLLLISKWWNFRPFPCIWQHFWSHTVKRKKRNPPPKCLTVHANIVTFLSRSIL